MEFTAAPPGLALDLDFTTGTLDSRVMFTRTTTGTYVNSSGVIASAAIDAARFDYDPATLDPRGLLLEEQRTNIVLHRLISPMPPGARPMSRRLRTARRQHGVANSASKLHITATAGNGTCLQAITLASFAAVSRPPVSNG